MEEPGIHTVHITEGNWDVMQNTQMRIQNRSYLITIYIAKNWYKNKNGHENRSWDTEKSPQYSQLFDNIIN